MINPKKTLALVAIFSCTTFFLSANSHVNFQNINLDEAKAQGKKILLSFSAEWCLPCKVMDESIFSDQEIATLVNENFVAVKADVDSETGNNWNELYNANYLPATLFASSTGHEIERLNGIPTRDEFLYLLKKILSTDKKATPTPSARLASYNEPIAKPVVEPVVETKIIPPTISSYVLQVGAFSTTTNAQKLINQLNDKAVYNAVILEEFLSSGKLLYKVQLNGYYSKEEARNDLSAIKQKGFEGFLKKM